MGGVKRLQEVCLIRQAGRASGGFGHMRAKTPAATEELLQKDVVCRGLGMGQSCGVGGTLPAALRCCILRKQLLTLRTSSAPQKSSSFTPNR